MIYNMYIFNRVGTCLFYHEWERPLKTFGEDKDEVGVVINTKPTHAYVCNCCLCDNPYFPGPKADVWDDLFFEAI
jgi:hypothetical protein